MERQLYKTALWFICSAVRNEDPTSAVAFFDNNIKLKREEKKLYERYRDIWGVMLLEEINKLPEHAKKVLRVAVVDAVPYERGFRIQRTSVRFDIIAMAIISNKSLEASELN
ncbi:TPA: hypothetical protein JBF73_07785 [Legionella pneumophila]|nr:hypothetical protein [Legionella pneumophila]